MTIWTPSLSFLDYERIILEKSLAYYKNNIDLVCDSLRLNRQSFLEKLNRHENIKNNLINLGIDFSPENDPKILNKNKLKK
jgi:hypothetical protein